MGTEVSPVDRVRLALEKIAANRKAVLAERYEDVTPLETDTETRRRIWSTKSAWRGSR